MKPAATDLLAVSKNVSMNGLVLRQRSAKIITQKVLKLCFITKEYLTYKKLILVSPDANSTKLISVRPAFGHRDG